MFKTIALFTVTALCMGAVYAQGLAPRHATTVDLGDHTAVIYYTVEGSEYEVVTTIGPNLGTEGPIVRHVSRVQAGEHFDIQFGSSGADKTLWTIVVSRSGDALTVATRNPPHLAQRH